MELPAFLLLSSNNIQHRSSAYINILNTCKQECRKMQSFKLYQYYEFGTDLTVDTHTPVWLSALISNQMQTYTGDIPSTKEALTTNMKFHTSSQTLPLPTHSLPKHLHYFTKDRHHLYFLSAWFVYYCDI